MQLSPSQAILMLIDNFNCNNAGGAESEDYQKLILLYLNGAVSFEDKEAMLKYFDDYKLTLLKDHTISFDNETINNDPTRRYFETHLAFNALKKEGLKYVSLATLNDFFKNLCGAFQFYDKAGFNKIDRFLNTKNSTNHEFLDYLNKIKEPENNGGIQPELFREPEYSSKERDKIRLIIKCTVVSLAFVGSTIMAPKLPLKKTYLEDLFRPEQRGRKPKAQEYKYLDKNKLEKKTQVSNQHYGLMKGHMPIAKDDKAMANLPFNFFKATESSSYVPNTDWVNINFGRAVHPFSNSISGTALCLIKALLYFRELPGQKSRLYFNNSQAEFDHFYRSFISTLLCFSGGHSLMEYHHVLNIPQVYNAFGVKNNNLNTDLHLESSRISRLFMFDDNKVLNDSLEQAIDYNNRYLKQKRLNEDIAKVGIESTEASFSNTAVFFYAKQPVQLKSFEKIKQLYESNDGIRWVKCIDTGNWLKRKKRTSQSISDEVDELAEGLGSPVKETEAQLNKKRKSNPDDEASSKLPSFKD